MVNCILIDDDPDIVEIFSELLHVIGIDILATGNDGKSAVELYKKHTPDLILTDLQMPRYDGDTMLLKISQTWIPMLNSL